MTLRFTARWEFLDSPPIQCPQCASALIPYVPHCTRCQTVVASSGKNMPFVPHGSQKHEQAMRVAHLSDLHIGQQVTPDKLMPMATFRIWLERLQRHQVDLIVLSGDVVERPGDTYGMTRARALLDDSDIPWLVVPGNHDVKRPGYLDEFNMVYGRYPRLEVHGEVDFVLFDSMAGLPLEERDVTERMYGDYVCYTEGRVGRSQFDAMSQALEARPEGRARAIVLHHHVMRQHADLMPLTPKQAGITEDLFGTMKALMDADELFAWARAHDIKTIYHGHKHLFQQPGLRDGNILVLNAGSSTLREGSQRARLVDYLPGRRVVSNVELLL
jgi:predicted phosphodiesterase